MVHYKYTTHKHLNMNARHMNTVEAYTKTVVCYPIMSTIWGQNITHYLLDYGIGSGECNISGILGVVYMR